MNYSSYLINNTHLLYIYFSMFYSVKTYFIFVLLLIKIQIVIQFSQILPATTVTAARSGGVGRENNAKPAMVFTANDLSKWESFPKGLRVLLLDSAAETRSKLESMDYIGEQTTLPQFLSNLFLLLFDQKKVYFVLKKGFIKNI